MIVTRQRKKKRNPAAWLLPLAAIAAAIFAFLWPPSHRAIADGPLKPVWNVAGAVGGQAARPLTFAAQQQHIADQNRTVLDLTHRLEVQRQAKEAADAKAAALQHTIANLNAQPRSTPMPATPIVTHTPAAAFGAAASGGSGAPAAPADASAGDKKMAATWGSMEPEKAAAMIQRLPDDEVVRVLAAMDPDSAAEILNALPPAVSARLSRDAAQVPAATVR